MRFTHPDRVYWIDVGVTKQDLADYYRSVWDWMAPHVVKPAACAPALSRWNEAANASFKSTRRPASGEKNLRTVIDSKRRQVIAVEDLDGLLSLVQAGVLELHVRGSTIDRLDVCDRIVFDIDPGDDVAWADVVAAARDVRERLAAIDLQSFVKLSGGKGLHVVLPIDGADWDTTKSFAQAVALAMTADDPKRYVAKMTKSLRKGKIFVDYLRNSLGADLGRGLFHPRARGCAGVGAGDVGGTGPHQERQPIHAAQSGQAPRRPEAGPVEGYRAGEAEAPEFADVARSVKLRFPDSLVAVTPAAG